MNGASRVMLAKRREGDIFERPFASYCGFCSFEKWGLDAVGPFPRTHSGKELIMVAIDYMTKWVEAMATLNVIPEQV